MTNLQQQIAELPEKTMKQEICHECMMPVEHPAEFHPIGYCWMYKQVHDSESVRVNAEYLALNHPAVKSLINELTEKVERYERMMAWAESVDGCDPETAICRDVDADNGTWQILDPLDRFIHERFGTALDAFESLSK